MHGDVIVMGAGPGGCAMAYHLQQAGWQVVLAERRAHAVDKLCGEFLSPEGVESLTGMGLGAALSQAAAPRIEDVLISTASGRTWQSPLPQPGLGLSRRCMDAHLIERCRAVGVHVVQGLHLREIKGDLTHGFYVRGESANGICELKARLAIGTFGKRSVLQRKLTLRGSASRVPHDLMALKCYARGGQVPGRVELHVFPGGYAGMSEVEGHKTNLCLLTKASVFRRAGSDAARFSREIMGQNPLLAQRLAGLQPDWPSTLAVGNLAFGSRSPVVNGVLMVGDAAAAIPPLCGDGMSMALQAAELLAPLAHQFLSGDFTGTALCRAYERQWRRRFQPRLWVGQGIQPFFLTPHWGEIAMTALNRFPGMGRQLIRWTRG